MMDRPTPIPHLAGWLTPNREPPVQPLDGRWRPGGASRGRVASHPRERFRPAPLGQTRSSLQRHGISRLPEVASDKPERSRLEAYPLAYFHIDLAEVHTAEGPICLLVALDRTTEFAFPELHG